jgi:TolA-binding protein
MERRMTACLILTLIGLTLSGCFVHSHRHDPDLMYIKIEELKQSQRQLRADIDELSARLDSLSGDSPSVIGKIEADIDELSQSVLDLEAQIEQMTGQPPQATFLSDIRKYNRSKQHTLVTERYESHIEAYPDAVIPPETLLDVAVSYDEVGDQSKYEALLREIITEYPDSYDAKLANDLLNAIPQ